MGFIRYIWYIMERKRYKWNHSIYPIRQDNRNGGYGHCDLMISFFLWWWKVSCTTSYFGIWIFGWYYKNRYIDVCYIGRVKNTVASKTGFLKRQCFYFTGFVMTELKTKISGRFRDSVYSNWIPSLLNTWEVITAKQL